MNISKLPKIELHVHLDGSVGIDLAEKLSDKSYEELVNEMVAKDKCVDLKDYLTKFSFPVSLMQSKTNLKEVAYNLSKELEKDNVLYAEVRFAPLKHIENISLDEVIESVLEGFKQGNVKVNLILCMMRNDSILDNKKVIDLASKYLNKGVCAIDLAGDEYNYKTKDFEELFIYAKEKNIPYTIHAGEADNYESVISALNFGTKRLGHGIRIIENNELMNYIKNNNILLEICLTSNIQTNVVDKIENHPIKLFKDLGILYSINTDNRTVSNTNLNKEYSLLEENLNFNEDDFFNSNISAIMNSFQSTEEKEKLLNEYIKVFNEMK